MSDLEEAVLALEAQQRRVDQLREKRAAYEQQSLQVVHFETVRQDGTGQLVTVHFSASFSPSEKLRTAAREFYECSEVAIVGNALQCIKEGKQLLIPADQFDFVVVEEKGKKE